MPKMSYKRGNCFYLASLLELIKYGMTVKQSITGAEKLYTRKLGRPGQSYQVRQWESEKDDKL